MDTILVIPAKAGIQFLEGLLIPAFAGVAGSVLFRKPLNPWILESLPVEFVCGINNR